MATTPRPTPRSRAVARRRAWREAICDRIEPRPYGCAYRATRFTEWWDVNAVVVERAEGLTAGGLVDAADTWLHGLSHRKVELWEETVGAPVAEELRARGWTVERLVAMHRPGATLDGPHVPELDPAAVDRLMVEWLLDEGTMHDEASIRAYLAEAAAAQALVPGTPAHLGHPGAGLVSLWIDDGREASIDAAYVSAGARGRGLGTELLRAAMSRAGGRDLWIDADADGRPRELYERLGFQAAWTYWDCVRRPPA